MLVSELEFEITLRKLGSLETAENNKIEGERETRFSRRREKTRRELLAAGRRVFARKTLAEATIKEIAEEADLGFGTFYLHFSSKEDIYHAILRQGFDELRRVLDESEKDHSKPLAQQQATILAYFNFAYANRDLFRMIFWSQGEGNTEVRRVREEMRERIAERVASLSQAGLIAWPEPKLLASLIVGIMSQAALWWLDNDSPTPEEMARLVGGFIARGVTGQLPPMLEALQTTVRQDR